MLPLVGRPSKTKTRTQSSEHGIVATGKTLLYNCIFDGIVISPSTTSKRADDYPAGATE
jgi:hypothetical protein